jgi:tetratricopeptide (TPR) repeat protein
MVEKQALDTWKEISAYLKRSERTCRRLEKDLGLPIHRLEDTPRARVFAYKEEIDRWVEKTQHSEKEIFFGKLSMKKFLIPVLIITILAIIVVVIWQILPQKKGIIPPSKKLSVAVISFENQTRDNSYDYLGKIIPNLLITSLEQSGYFYVTSWEKLHDLLKQIGKADVEFIDEGLGFELGRMDGVEAIVLGSFTKVGDVFVTDMKVLDLETKRILKSANSRGKGEESILRSQIDELSKEISHGLSVSEGQIDEASIHIADVTTDSLDAYVYYVRGKECLDYQNIEDARKFLKKAIELDPSFAMAYLYLGDSYPFSFEAPAEREVIDENFKKAKKFSARATEKERLYIEGAYARIIERDVEKSFRIYKKMVKHYPKEKNSHYRLGIDYLWKGLFNQAIKEFNTALELDPYYTRALNSKARSYKGLRNYEKQIETLNRYRSVSPGNTQALEGMAEAYIGWGKLDEALAKYKEALEIDPDFGRDWGISYIYALKEDYTEAMRWIDRYINEAIPLHKGWGNNIKSFYLYWIGSLDKSMNNLLRTIDSAEKTKIPQWKVTAHWMTGWVSLDRGEFEMSRKHFKYWFDLIMPDLLPSQPYPSGVDNHWFALYHFYLGLVDLKQGEIKSAKIRLIEINSLLPDMQPQFKDWIKFYHNFLQAEILLEQGTVEKAITVGEKFSFLGWHVGNGMLMLNNVPFFKDVLARAYLQNGEIEKAIAEYERLIVFDPKEVGRYLIHPKYYYRLAQLYEHKGLKSKTIENYEKFLALWKHADPDHPEVEDAKKRLAGLKDQA